MEQNFYWFDADEAVAVEGEMMTLHGGKLKEIPKPWKREFPSKTKKQRVYTNIHSYRGFVPGAIHWHASLEEENNLIWNRKKRCWQMAWDDEKAKGRCFLGAAFMSQVEAHDWIEQMRQDNFPERTHVLVEEHGTNRRWIYKRSGD